MLSEKDLSPTGIGIHGPQVWCGKMPGGVRRRDVAKLYVQSMGDVKSRIDIPAG
jgi:hypothetical protein